MRFKMHEFSIVSSLLENCRQVARENGASKIMEVYVQIGRRSGVNASLFKRAFEEFKVGEICQNAELFIEEVEVEIFCKNCNQESKIVEICYTQCPLCKSEQVEMIRGNEMLLMRLVME